MNLSQHLHEIVEPNAADFLRDRANLRPGLNAAWSLDSSASHLFEVKKEAGCIKDKKERDGKFKRRVANANYDFNVVWSVSTVAKHGKISGKIIDTSDEVHKARVEGPLAMVSVVSDHTDWGDRILVVDDERGGRPLNVAVQNTLERLRSECARYLRSKAE